MKKFKDILKEYCSDTIDYYSFGEPHYDIDERFLDGMKYMYKILQKEEAKITNINQENIKI